MPDKRKELVLNKGHGKARYTVDIPLIDVHGPNIQDCIDSVVLYIQDHSEELFKEAWNGDK